VTSNRIMDKSKLKRSTLAIAVALSLSACSESSSPEVALKSLETVVADGYIRGALVCFDTNGDGFCTDEKPEYIGTTDENGKVTINVPADFASRYPLIAQFTAQSFDVERNQATGEGGYSAPVGKTDALTPLTTLVHKEIVKDPTINIDTAVENVKTLLQIDPTKDDVDLFKDHIAEAENDDAYKKLALKAELAHDVLDQMEEAVEAVKTALDGTDVELSDSEALQLAFNQLENQLRTLMESLQAEIETAETNGDDLGTLAVTTTVTTESFKIPTAEELETELDEVKSAELITSAEAAEIKATLKTGIYGFTSGSYDKITLSADETTLLFEYYEYNGSQWEKWVDTDSDEGSYNDYCLGTNGWKQDTDDEDGITINADNTATVDTGCSTEIAQLKAMDLSGKRWSEIYDGLLPSTVPSSLVDKSFTEGAKAYLLSLKLLQDEYRLENYSGDCSDLGGNCNVARNPVTYEAATSFDDILVTAGASLRQDARLHLNGNGVGGYLSIIGSAGDQEGKAKIFVPETSSTGAQVYTELGGMAYTELMEIDWVIKTINTVQIMIFPQFPSAFRGYDDEDLTLVLDNGFVRRGGVKYASDEFKIEDIFLGKAALDQVITDADFLTFLESQNSSDSSSSDGSSSSDSSSSDGSDFGPAIAITDAEVARKAFVTSDSVITFFEGGSGQLFYSDMNGIGSEDITWSVVDSMIKVTYSDQSVDSVSIAEGQESNAYNITIDSSTDGVSYDTVWTPKALALWQLDDVTLTFVSDNECTGSDDSTKVTFSSVTQTEVSGTLVEVCDGVTSTSALTVLEDPELDNVLNIMGTDNGVAYTMNAGIAHGDLMSGAMSFVEVTSDGEVKDIFFDDFTGMCTMPKMWSAAMGHCMVM